jgi:prephenate dehydratase
MTELEDAIAQATSDAVRIALQAGATLLCHPDTAGQANTWLEEHGLAGRAVITSTTIEAGQLLVVAPDPLER